MRRHPEPSPRPFWGQTRRIRRPHDCRTQSPGALPPSHPRPSDPNPPTPQSDGEATPRERRPSSQFLGTRSSYRSHRPIWSPHFQRSCSSLFSRLILRLENDREGSHRKTVVFRCHADANVGGRGYTTISERVNLVTSETWEVCRTRVAIRSEKVAIEKRSYFGVMLMPMSVGAVTQRFQNE